MEFIELYTDGGTRGNGNVNAVGGYGVYLKYIVNGELIHELELKGGEMGTTNNKMELQGAIQGLKAIHNKDLETHMYIDSQYVKNGIEIWINNWKRNGWKTANKKDVKNKELWQTLDNMIDGLKNFFDIKFVKVKGHAGNKWNEKCDQLANEAMNEI